MNMKIFLMIGLLFIVSGCFMGELGIYGQAREDYLKSIKPMRDRWQREQTSDDIRNKDWITCGGSNDGNVSDKRKVVDFDESNKKIDEIKIYSLLVYQVERCMLTKGYRYTGKCYDNQISRESPSCRAP